MVQSTFLKQWPNRIRKNGFCTSQSDVTVLYFNMSPFLHYTMDLTCSCGTKRCPRSAAKECFDILNENYKYYLAFENSNCIDYITEKFFVNGLMNNIVPIVMGGRKEDYVRSSPPHSFIHVDDFESPKDLAIFLHSLNSNPLKYQSYLNWKSSSGEFINTYFWCRLCALLHSPRAMEESHSYEDIHSWWNHPGTCSNAGWKRRQ